jgi:hypothetical protein
VELLVTSPLKKRIEPLSSYGKLPSEKQSNADKQKHGEHGESFGLMASPCQKPEKPEHKKRAA